MSAQLPSLFRKVPAHAAFFPAAALYALVVLPLSVLCMTGLTRAPHALASAFGHAHEMLFGYGLAVVAGYLLGSLSAGRLLTLLGLWVAARASFLLTPQSLVSVAFN